MKQVPSHIDHLVYGTPDLDETVSELESRLGVRATPGGQHRGRGTRNALLSLGPTSYLEILGPDSQQPRPAAGRWMGIDCLDTPRLVRWCVVHSDLDALVLEAANADLTLGGVQATSRTLADGRELTWRLTDPSVVAGDGLIPFFIDWGASPHPAASAADGITLSALKVQHPRPSLIRRLLEVLKMGVPVQAGPTPAIIATLRTPNGSVDLR